MNHALKRGTRGLPGGTTLAELLAKERGVRNKVNLPPLSRKLILGWADAYHRREDKWPTLESGAIPGVPGETWASVDAARKRVIAPLLSRVTLFMQLESSLSPTGDGQTVSMSLDWFQLSRRWG